MIERFAEATDTDLPLMALPVDVHASGISPEGRAVIAAVKSGLVTVDPVETVCIDPINTDVQGLKH